MMQLSNMSQIKHITLNHKNHEKLETFLAPFNQVFKAIFRFHDYLMIYALIILIFVSVFLIIVIKNIYLTKKVDALNIYNILKNRIIHIILD